MRNHFSRLAMVLAALFLHLSCFAANITCGGGTSADYFSYLSTYTYNGHDGVAPAIIDSATYSHPQIIKKFQYWFLRNNCYNSTAGNSADATLIFQFPSETTPTVTDNPNFGLTIDPLNVGSLLTGNPLCSVAKSTDSNGILTITVTIPKGVTSTSQKCSFTFGAVFNVWGLASLDQLKNDTKLISGTIFTKLRDLPPAATTGKFGIAVWTTITGGTQALPMTSARVVIPSCTLSPSPNFNLAVSLPKVDVSALNAAGKTAGTTTFSIPLSGCTTGVYKDPSNPEWYVKAFWSFTPAPNTTNTIANSAPYPNPATNVALQMLDTTGTPIEANSKTLISHISTQTSGVAGVTAPTYKIDNPNPQFSVRYYALGPAGPGAVKGSATFNLYYE